MDLLRSLPLGLYLEQPHTWLHRVDARVKFAWLMTFLAAPLLANAVWRVGLAISLIALTLTAAIPFRVWRQQMGWLLFLAIFAFGLTCVTPDGLAVYYQPRLPSVAVSPSTASGYSYVVWHHVSPAPFPELWITRRSLDLAIRLSTLLFTLIYSSNLFLLTTAPEEITLGLEKIFFPLKRWGWPVTEVILTLTLALRFIPLVLEEIQNLVRSIRTRAIHWKSLGIRRSLRVWLTVSEKLLENLLLRAEQIALAMEARGFTSPNRHQVAWHQLRFHWGDWLLLLSLLPFWGARLLWGMQAFS